MEAIKTTIDNCAERLQELKCCVIIPTYNNAQKLEEVINSAKEYTSLVLDQQHEISHLLVVNDGSTDDTATILERHPSIMQLSYQPNAGKGIAMRRAFKYAIEKGYDYAITFRL